MITPSISLHEKPKAINGTSITGVSIIMAVYGMVSLNLKRMVATTPMVRIAYRALAIFNGILLEILGVLLVLTFSEILRNKRKIMV
jgi:hypothetical protein